MNKMTDEQIETTLQRNAKNIGGGFDAEVLNYIHRLKADIVKLKQSDKSKEKYTIEQHDEIHRLRDKVKQIRKNTAKEILQMWNDENMARLRPEEAEQVAHIAKDYGVGVDE